MVCGVGGLFLSAVAIADRGPGFHRDFGVVLLAFVRYIAPDYLAGLRHVATQRLLSRSGSWGLRLFAMDKSPFTLDFVAGRRAFSDDGSLSQLLEPGGSAPRLSSGLNCRYFAVVVVGSIPAFDRCRGRREMAARTRC